MNLTDMVTKPKQYFVSEYCWISQLKWSDSQLRQEADGKKEYSV